MSNRRKAAVVPAPELERRGLVELFLTEPAPGEATKVGLEMYPPDRKSVSVEMLAAEAAALGNALLEAPDRAEKENASA